jgi:hypothetical protein
VLQPVAVGTEGPEILGPIIRVVVVQVVNVELPDLFGHEPAPFAAVPHEVSIGAIPALLG